MKSLGVGVPEPILDSERHVLRDGGDPAGLRRAVDRLAIAGPVRYPNCYVWFVFLSAMDIMLTWVVLSMGGMEANPLVDRVLVEWGLQGIVAYKFGLVMLVIWVCEVVGRQRDRSGRRLAEWMVAIALIPVYLAMVQLLLNTHVYGG